VAIAGASSSALTRRQRSAFKTSAVDFGRIEQMPSHDTCALACVVLLALAGCGGGGGGGDAAAPPLSGVDVVTPGIESYITDHNGFSRVRTTPGGASGDAAVLAQIDAGQSGPAGFRDVVDGVRARFSADTVAEVIAQTDGTTNGPATRLLRLTMDQAPFENADRDGRPVTQGQFFFRGIGQHIVWARVDGGALQRSVGDLENLMVDFGTGAATIDLRTPFDPPAGNAIETSIQSSTLAFDRRSGAFGGPVTMTSRVAGETLTAQGVLRGNLTATPEGLSGIVKSMTTSGLYAVDGPRLEADGVFAGTQPP
jgi:hypothetical protein